MSPFDQLHPAVQHHIVNSLGWAELRPMQLRAVEPIHDGKHVLILAPTAGGKTEAAVLPLLSRMLEERWSGLSVLYICPIKALLNNLEPRMSRLLGYVGRRVALWHGDVSAAARQRMLNDPPDLVLTTPESLEAMLISRRVEHPSLFACLKSVVIDELHAFAADDRGWHLLAVMERLQRLANRPLQRIGLSATVGNPAELLDWMAAHVPGERVVLAPGGGPSGADADVKIDHVGSLENAATVISRLHAGEKRLVFCDSRSKAEQLAANLRERSVQTFVSHGSLGIDERRRAESAFAEGSNCVIVATSTLELGIDVGDLDRVIQVDAPSSVSSFLQRLGRTGRRERLERNCLFLTTGTDAFLRAAGIVLLWSEGYVEPVCPPPSPWHIFAQQTLALCLQEPRFAFDDHESWLGALPVFASAMAGRLVSFMKEAGYLFEDGGLLGIGLKAEREFGRHNFLDLVAAFASPPLFAVRHGRQELGQVHASSFARNSDRPTVLLLAGRNWAVTGLDWSARVAWVEPSTESGRSRWEGTSRALNASLCHAMRRILAGTDLGSRLSKRARIQWETLREDFAWCESEGTVLLRTEDKRWCWWTFAGLSANALLAAALDRQGIGIIRTDNTTISLDAVSLDDAVNAIDIAKLSDLTPQLPVDAASDLKFGACLPEDLRATIIAERFFDHLEAERVLREKLSVIDARTL